MAFFDAVPHRFLTLETTMTDLTTPQPKKRRLSADEKCRIYQDLKEKEKALAELSV